MNLLNYSINLFRFQPIRRRKDYDYLKRKTVINAVCAYNQWLLPLLLPISNAWDIKVIENALPNIHRVNMEGIANICAHNVVPKFGIDWWLMFKCGDVNFLNTPAFLNK